MRTEAALHFTLTPFATLADVLNEIETNVVFVLMDENTAKFCSDGIATSKCEKLACAHQIVIPAGDENKSITSLSHIWSELVAGGATRQSLLINLGGGVVTDIGGFAAATFKRGIRHINLPTTLLSAVDAAVGGKTGINFSGLKNEVGAFWEARHVIISPAFYNTLPHEEFVSGYGEVIKHALLNSKDDLAKALAFDLVADAPSEILDVLRESVEVKCRIVAADPREQGIRRALNLGHTAAHAFEALTMMQGGHLAHGVAVAHGLVVDLVLSHMIYGFSSATLHQVATYIKTYFPTPQIECKDYPQLIEFMRHDKKNSSAQAINFTLLSAPGEVKLDTIVEPEQIETALDIMRDLLGA